MIRSACDRCTCAFTGTARIRILTHHIEASQETMLGCTVDCTYKPMLWACAVLTPALCIGRTNNTPRASCVFKPISSMERRNQVWKEGEKEGERMWEDERCQFTVHHGLLSKHMIRTVAPAPCMYYVMTHNLVRIYCTACGKARRPCVASIIVRGARLCVWPRRWHIGCDLIRPGPCDVQGRVYVQCHVTPRGHVMCRAMLRPWPRHWHVLLHASGF